MTKTIKLIIGAVLLLLIILGITFMGNSSAQAQSEQSKRIGELEIQINELRTLKENCYNNLSYRDSVLLSQGKVKLCYNRDEEIMKLREEADKLKAKNYMGLAKE